MIDSTTLPTSTDGAARLTSLLERNPSFSFLRLGDGELGFLLECQGAEPVCETPELRPSCEVAYGHPGLDRQYYSRLLTSYEQCSFLDRYGRQHLNRTRLRDLRWERRADSLGEADSGELGFIFEWVHTELPAYLARHRTVVCGAEAALMRGLLKHEEYRRIVAPYWPADAAVFFHQPRRNGAHLSVDLDAIKADLRAAIVEHRADTLLLSLGGGAKIIAYELATELGIRAIDFGSALRSLTYSGSDGHAAWRAPHHPFLVRVPFGLFMRALRAAHPDLDATTLVAKAQAQLCLELHRKELLISRTSDANDVAMFDASPENRRNFFQSLAEYRKTIVPLARSDASAWGLVREFRRWRWKKALGWDGRLFRMAVVAKGLLRRLMSPASRTRD